MPPVVIYVQSPPPSIWTTLLGPLIGLFGVGLGVLLGSLITRRRERGHYVWEQRCELYMDLLARARRTMVTTLAFPATGIAPTSMADDKVQALCEIFATEEMSRRFFGMENDNRRYQEVAKSVDHAAIEAEPFLREYAVDVVTGYSMVLEQINKDLGTKRRFYSKHAWADAKWFVKKRAARVRGCLSRTS